jgi:hypothetical protein
MKNEIILTSNQYSLLLEALRRFIRFADNKTLKSAWTGLGYKTVYKPVLDARMMVWVDYVVPRSRTMGWLTLTDLGAKIVQKWIDDGYTQLYFDGHWETPVNENNLKPPKSVVFAI